MKITVCGGKGSCGRCRISAPSLPVTDRDRKFLTPDEIERGVRLACDKTVCGEAEIEADIARGEVKAERYERADAYAVFCDNATYIGLQDGGEVRDGLELPPVEAKYAYLRGAAQKETIELFEKHSLAKADVFLLAASPARFTELTGIAERFAAGQTLGAELMSMPAEDVYLPPAPKTLVGSDILLEFALREAGEFVVSGRYFAYLDEASLHVAYVASEDAAIFSKDSRPRAQAISVKTKRRRHADFRARIHLYLRAPRERSTPTVSKRRWTDWRARQRR